MHTSGGEAVTASLAAWKHAQPDGNHNVVTVVPRSDESMLNAGHNLPGGQQISTRYFIIACYQSAAAMLRVDPDAFFAMHHGGFSENLGCNAFDPRIDFDCELAGRGLVQYTPVEIQSAIENQMQQNQSAR